MFAVPSARVFLPGSGLSHVLVCEVGVPAGRRFFALCLRGGSSLCDLVLVCGAPTSKLNPEPRAEARNLEFLSFSWSGFWAFIIDYP